MWEGTSMNPVTERRTKDIFRKGRSKRWGINCMPQMSLLCSKAFEKVSLYRLMLKALVETRHL